MWAETWTRGPGGRGGGWTGSLCTGAEVGASDSDGRLSPGVERAWGGSSAEPRGGGVTEEEELLLPGAELPPRSARTAPAARLRSSLVCLCEETKFVCGKKETGVQRGVSSRHHGNRGGKSRKARKVKDSGGPVRLPAAPAQTGSLPGQQAAAASHHQGAYLPGRGEDGSGGGAWAHSPGPALPVGALPRAAAVADVVAVDGDQLLPALGGLLLLPEAVVLPAALVPPQLPVASLGSEERQKDVSLGPGGLRGRGRPTSPPPERGP